jgi:hypothetical protein
LWARQRAGQRSPDRALIKLLARPARLAEVLRVVDAVDGTLVGRAALGTSYVEAEVGALSRLRHALAPGEHAVVLDAPAELAPEQRWGTPQPAALALMQRVKERFDPALACNPGGFVGGI